MGRIRTIFQIGRKSSTLETTRLVYDPETDDYFFRPVYREELDRRRAVRTIPQAYAEFKRLIASSFRTS